MKHIILSLLIFAMISVQVLARDKLALVVGNNSYSGMFDSLNNSVNDARKMAEALEDLGFKVILELNASQETIELAIDKFGEKLSKDSVGLFYFSGHAAQYKDVNYLVPTNFIKNSNKLRHRATPVGFVLAEMKTANNGLNIVILDACRNILEEIQDKGYGDAGGLGKMQAISGSVIAYATQPGFKSYEDRTQDNSYYTKHLLRFIKQDGLSLTELFSEVSLAVSKETKGKQEPWTSFLSLPKFCLAGCDGIMPPRNGLAELLKTCQSYMNQDWFTTSPTGQTALNCYQRVLKLDANNRQAFQAFEEMEDYYVDAVVKYLRNNNKRQAEKYLVRLRKVSPESPIIDEFEDQIVVIDSDNDGIADNQDRCSNTPRGTKVKSNGCPVSVDSDNDGIFDAQDRCSNTPRGTKVKSNGCPVSVDSDNDGIFDAQDRCPNTPRGTKVKSNGCPVKNYRFIKFNYQGRSLSNSASSWSCVKDTHSGLIWEKKSKSNGNKGDNLHDADDEYTWYNTDNTSNGGSDGYPDRSYNRDCYGYRSGKASSYCNTQAYTARVNAERYCGFNDWRMPTIDELKYLVDKARKSAEKRPTININYFPNTKSNWFWSGSPLAGDPDGAWDVDFDDGVGNYGSRSGYLHVRLVRGGQ